tara:strand:- start:747 stop:1007 length:261 start_codon:yes stop_codon:yes gene_type:complete
MASINLVKLTDTFNTFMDLVNSIINKINKIEVDSATVKLDFSSSVPADSTLSANQAVLFFDSSGALKIRRCLSNGTTYETKTVDLT